MKFPGSFRGWGSPAGESVAERPAADATARERLIVPTGASSSAAAGRTRWLDSAKGLGILLVVYGHAARALYDVATAPAWVRTTDRVIYAFHMPLFFLVAGLFVWPSLAKGRGRFVRDKLATIVWPYVLWSLVEGMLEVAFAPEVNSPISWRELAMIPIAPIEQFWFLYVMALCLLLTLICYPSRAALAVVAAVGLLVADRYGMANIGLRTLAFFAYVVAGVLFAAPVRALGDGSRRTAIVLAGAAILFGLGIAAGVDGVLVGFVVAVAGSVATLAMAARIGDSRVGAVLALLGRASLAIYVTHTIFSAGVRIGFRVAGLTMPIPLMLAMTVVAGVVGPVALWLMAERQGLSLLLGLGRPLR